ncbi:MAG: class I SAM-dependent methyltransferase [Prochlorothrix sp.]|nr:class I SAM-dependent methyltransferase [Prochlorothrix sp.]
MTSASANRILSDRERSKLDDTSDTFFYAQPRLVTHVDETFIDRLTQLYAARLRPQSRVLDLMSSWVSHLPDIPFDHVEGHGMNEAELAKNPRLDHYFVQNLNHSPSLPLEDDSFDAVLIAVSVQYLQEPETVFQEIRRVLKPDGQAIVSFSNRMFYQKAIAAWRDGSDSDHVNLVCRYFWNTPGFKKPQIVAEANDEVPAFLRMMGFGSRDPFYAIVAEAEPLAPT